MTLVRALQLAISAINFVRQDETSLGVPDWEKAEKRIRALLKQERQKLLHGNRSEVDGTT